MLRLILLIVVLLCPLSAIAQEGVGEPQDGFDVRLDLADQMLTINSPRDQVRAAIDGYIVQTMGSRSAREQDQFRMAMMRIVNHRAVENISREAYADIFTEGELRAMVEYYSKPEAISARAKLEEFQGRITPEIIRMIDQAIMRARTSAE